MPKHRFPQDFPPHLDPLAPTEPLSGSTPLGNHPLKFEDMHAPQFEQFCWWLLQRDHDIKGCQLIGGSGRAQGGIDLFGYAQNDKTQLIVFECKCWESFNSTALGNAIELFLAGPWAIPGTRFVLIVAQQSIEQFSRAWHDARRKLRARKIVGELWTGVHLTECIRLHPDILSRFFPGVATDMYCNEWMRRVDFWMQLQKALVDERYGVRRIAHAFLGQKSREDEAEPQLEKIHAYDNNWSIESPWIHIDALLPNKRFFSGSIGIVVKKRSTSGLTVALSQEWLLKNLFAHTGAPAEHTYRPFIVGPVSLQPNSEITIDLHSARLQIPSEGLDTMCSALDKLAPVYTDALHALGQRWGAQGFPFIDRGSDTVVAICTVPTRLWNQMLNFVREHDADAGDSNWNIFDANPHYLKVYTTKPHPDFDQGYHAFIRARSGLDGLSYGDNVVLTWDPPNSFEDFELAPRQWMTCAETLTWIRDKFLPAVGQWLIEREVHASWPWRRPAQRRALTVLWAQQTRIWEHRQLPLLQDERYRTIGLLATTEELQANMGNGAPQLFLTPSETRKLFLGVVTIMQGGRGHVPYISSNLGLRQECHTHSEIIQALEKRIQEDLSPPSAYAVRCLLSAMLEGLNDNDVWLPVHEVELIYSSLKPLMYHQDLVQLFERHSRWM